MNTKNTLLQGGLAIAIITVVLKYLIDIIKYFVERRDLQKQCYCNYDPTLKTKFEDMTVNLMKDLQVIALCVGSIEKIAIELKAAANTKWEVNSAKLDTLIKETETLSILLKKSFR